MLFSLLISLVSFSRLSNGIFGELLASWFLPSLLLLPPLDCPPSALLLFHLHTRKASRGLMGAHFSPPTLSSSLLSLFSSLFHLLVTIDSPLSLSSPPFLSPLPSIPERPAMGSLGMTKKWTGALGSMSWNARDKASETKQ